MILKIGGHAGGWSFYLKDGCPTFCYNLFGLERAYVRGTTAVPVGDHQIRVEFAYDGGGTRCRSRLWSRANRRPASSPLCLPSKRATSRGG
jgi:hypothetical protein